MFYWKPDPCGPAFVLLRPSVEGLGMGGYLATVDASGVTYSVLDAMGTVRATTDGSGAVIARYQCHSFGQATGSEGTEPPQSWQGLAADGTGLLTARARTYDPSTGRFLSEDPLPGGNAYAYAGSSPLALSDPTGLAALVEYSGTNSENESRAPEVCKQGSWTAGIFTDIALDVAIEVALAPLMGEVGLYSFMDNSGKPGSTDGLR